MNEFNVNEQGFNIIFHKVAVCKDVLAKRVTAKHLLKYKTTSSYAKLNVIFYLFLFVDYFIRQ